LILYLVLVMISISATLVFLDYELYYALFNYLTIEVFIAIFITLAIIIILPLFY